MITLPVYAARYKDMEPHTDTLARLAGDADRILEFGVRGGVSTWALLDGLKPGGRLWSVDTDDTTATLPRRITDDPRWSFIHGDDCVVDLPAADLVLIDTTHEYHHTLAELQIAASLGARRIVLHDWALPDVQDAVRGFCDRTPWRIQSIEPSQWELVVLA